MKANKTALVTAVDLLARRPQSIKMLNDKLRYKGYSEDETEEAIQILLQRGYLNDAELCQRVYRQWVEAGKFSLKQIFYKLLNKGFDAELIGICQRDEDVLKEQQAALAVLRIRYQSSDQVEPLRMMQYLYGKGFRRESIQTAVQNFTAVDCRDFGDY